MCECDAVIRDLQHSNQRYQEELQTIRRDYQMMTGIMHTLSYSMKMNSKARSLDEARWQDAARWLAKQLALQTNTENLDFSLFAHKWLTSALNATEGNHATTTD